MKFIDLFAGLGGFHVALSRLGHECVYACEIDIRLNQDYYNNFKIKPDLDIRDADLKKIPKYDILCAGFPCQPFSKAGSQSGFNHKVAGDMFEVIINFLKEHKPKYFFLENVTNLLKHNKGLTWLYMSSKLEGLGYNVGSDIISPISFNIPQNRERFYILGSLGNNKIKWPIPPKKKSITIIDILVKEPKRIVRLSKEKSIILNIWEDFLKRAPSNYEILSPMWSMEFGATYPFEETTPFAIGIKKLKSYKGSFGKNLSKVNDDEVLNYMPPYALYSNKKNDNEINKMKFPKWKIIFIKNCRDYYKKNKKWIDPWLKINKSKDEFQIPSFQKFEWNCYGDDLSLNNKLVTFRSSGVRVKRIESSPTLVNISSTGLPYITSEKRYFTLEECLNLQGFHEKKFLKFLEKNNDSFYFRALGNAVNVDIIEVIASTFLSKKNNIVHRDVSNQLKINF
ncbi:DNA (cytosine-5-)-methyltransferase [bacterium]|nr:DNA (cytosine-5-)-methyltransferase [bacterium]